MIAAAWLLHCSSCSCRLLARRFEGSAHAARQNTWNSSASLTITKFLGLLRFIATCAHLARGVMLKLLRLPISFSPVVNPAVSIAAAARRCLFPPLRPRVLNARCKCLRARTTTARPQAPVPLAAGARRARSIGRSVRCKCPRDRITTARVRAHARRSAPARRAPCRLRSASPREDAGASTRASSLRPRAAPRQLRSLARRHAPAYRVPPQWCSVWCKAVLTRDVAAASYHRPATARMRRKRPCPSRARRHARAFRAPPRGHSVW